MTAPCIVCRTGVALSGNRDADGDLTLPGHEYFMSNPVQKVRGFPYRGPVCSACCKAYRKGVEDMEAHTVPVLDAFRRRVAELEQSQEGALQGDLCDGCGEPLIVGWRHDFCSGCLKPDPDPQPGAIGRCNLCDGQNGDNAPDDDRCECTRMCNKCEGLFEARQYSPDDQTGPCCEP